jgi:CRP-like cAMP-binding protein
MNPNVEYRDSRQERTRAARDGLRARWAKRKSRDPDAESEIRLAPPQLEPIPATSPRQVGDPTAQTDAGTKRASRDGFDAPSISGATRGSMGLDPPRNMPAASHFAAGEEVVGGGDAAKSFYLIVSGVFRGVGYTADGRRSIFAFYWPGDICGLEPDPVHKLTLEAVTEGTVTVLSRSVCKARMLADATFAAEMFDKTVRSLSGSAEHLMKVGHGSAEECIAYFLGLLIARAKGDVNGGLTLDLAMSRQDIVDFLGLTIETVSRVFTAFRKRGLIHLMSPRRLEIRNGERLKRLDRN